MTRHTVLLPLLAALLLPHTARAQLALATDSMLHRLFASNEFAGEPHQHVQWLDGNSYTILEPSPDLPGPHDIVRYTTTGEREVLVAAHELQPEGTPAPLPIAGYTWSPDRNRLLIFTNTRKVWRQNTRGDYWVLDRRSHTLRKLGGPDAQPATLMFAKFSPDGDRVAYVREGDLYVEHLPDGTINRLTRDASRTTVNGTSDWVYEEEFGLRDGFRWSPDGTRIAYWQFDMSGVRDFLLIDNTDSLYSFTTPIQYPKAGQTNSAVRVGVVAATGGPTTWIQLAGDPRQNYIPRMEWADANELLLQYMNRHQNRDEVTLADARTGLAHPILTETDSAWVDVVDGPRWLADHRHFLWESERDGWRHLYIVSSDGRDVRLVTPGAYDVVALAGLDERDGLLYVIASPSNATQRYLYRVSLRSPGPPARVTPGSQPGTHEYDLSPDGRWALHTYSTFDTPPTEDLVSLPSHTVVRSLGANARLRARLASLTQRPAEFFTVSLDDGATLDGWMLRPRDFDSTRTYPVFVQVYGEPAGQTVLDRWGGTRMLWHRMIADLGYVVISVDNRGTPAPKGRAWRKIIYGAIGPLSSREQANAVQLLTRARHYLDSTRVGIWGWSGGGSSTLNALFRYPTVYQVGMAVAPVPDQQLYDSIYEERYVGLPQEDPNRYRVSSPINFAEGLRGKLLLVHGTGDDNVHYQGAERLINRLVSLGKPFDFMSYPNRTHCICEGSGTTLHVFSLLTRYLTTNLTPGPR